MKNNVLVISDIIDDIFDFCDMNLCHPKKYAPMCHINKKYYKRTKERKIYMLDILTYYFNYKNVSLVHTTIIVSEKFQKHLVNNALKINNEQNITDIINNFSSKIDFKFGYSYLISQLVIQNKIEHYKSICEKKKLYVNDSIIFNKCCTQVVDHYKISKELLYDDKIIMTFVYYHHIINIIEQFKELECCFKKITTYENNDTDYKNRCIEINMKHFQFLKNLKNETYVAVIKNLSCSNFIGFNVPSCLDELYSHLLNETHVNKYNILSVYLCINILMISIFDLSKNGLMSYKKLFIIDKINKLCDTNSYLFESFYTDHAVFSAYENISIGQYIFNCISNFFKGDCKYWQMSNIIILQHFPFISNTDELHYDFYNSFAYLYK